MRAGISFHRGPPTSDVVFQHPIMEDPPSLLVDYHSPWQIPDSPLISEEPEMFDTLNRAGVGWSITTPQYSNVREAIAAIGEDAWNPHDGMTQVAETVIWATHRTRRTQRMKLRLIVRRTRIVGPQAPLWPDWRYHTFVTNLDQPPTEADQHHHDTENNRHLPNNPPEPPGTSPTLLTLERPDQYRTNHPHPNPYTP